MSDNNLFAAIDADIEKALQKVFKGVFAQGTSHYEIPFLYAALRSYADGLLCGEPEITKSAAKSTYQLVTMRGATIKTPMKRGDSDD